jgi:glycosyltransferase involved in cell wall biosynthesis
VIAEQARAPLIDERLPEPRHVLFVTGEYPPMRGGVGDYTRCLSRALAELGTRCTVLTSRSSSQPARRAPLEPLVLPAMPSWGLADLPLLLRLVGDVRPDVVHIQYQTGAFGMGPAINLLFPVLRLRRGHPLLAVTFHDLKEPYLFPKAGVVRRWANEAVRRGADLVFVTNGADLAALRGEAGVLPIGSNLRRLPLDAAQRAAVRARLGIGADEVAVGYFGFVDPWKGVDVLVAACEQLWADGRRLRLVFVGGVRAGGVDAMSPHEREVRARLEGSVWRGQVVRTDYASPEEASAYLQALDVCALPFAAGACYRHGSLMAAIEHALPIVTTLPDPAESSLGERGVDPLVDGENALLVPRGDAAALAAAIARLSDDPTLRARLADGAARLAPRFGWDQIARGSLAAYERLLARA